MFAGLAACCAAALAGEQPPPKAILGLYRAGTRDYVRISAGEGNTVHLSLKLYFSHGHTCRLDRDGQWRADHVLIVAAGIEPDEPCRLQASFANGRIRLRDEGQQCARVYCGTRGKLDGVSLPKQGRARR